MNKFKTLILSLLLVVGVQAMAQTQSQKHGYMFISAAFPTGDFAKGDDFSALALGSNAYNEGGAGVGFNVGLKWDFNVGVPGLGVMLSLDGFFNGPNADMKDFYKNVKSLSEIENNNVTVRSPKYINVPAMLGVNYCYYLNPQFGLYAEAGLGGNLRFITNYTVKGTGKVSNKKNSVTYDYNSALSFAYQLGLGIEVSKSLVIGFSYYDLGKADVKGEFSSVLAGNDVPSTSFEYASLHPMMLLGRIGFRF